MALNNYSMYISTVPWSQGITDNDFMFIGSSQAYPQSIQYNSSTTGILGQTPDTAIFVDGVGGAVLKINISQIRVQPKGQEYCSNKQFIETLLNMRTAIQMMNNQYVLRIYNISQVSKGDTEQDILAKRKGQYKEKFVFLESFDASINIERPNEINTTLNLIERNKLKGYNE